MKTISIVFCAMLMSLLLTAPTSAQGASYVQIAAGCPGSAGVPSLNAAADSSPILGETFSVELTNVPSSSIALGIIGLSISSWGTSPLPLDLSIIGMPSCLLYTDIRRQIGLVIAGGTTTWDTTLPSTAEWIGVSFYQQVFVVDDSVPGLGAVMSDANEGVIGAPPFGRFAYVANFSSNNVTTFSIDQTTGALSEVGSEVPAGDRPVSVTVDPTGRFA